MCPGDRRSEPLAPAGALLFVAGHGGSDLSLDRSRPGQGVRLVAGSLTFSHLG